MKSLKISRQSERDNGALISTIGAFEEKYKLSGNVLGEGSYAKVQLAVQRSSGKRVAVKILKRSQMKKSDIKKVDKEVSILKRMRHKNIVQVFDAFVDNEKGVYYIVMEFAPNGDLFAQIVDEKLDFTEIEAQKIMRPLISALKYCKELGIVHRDIKPDNILLGEDNQIKIADFNLSKMMSSFEIQFSVLETQCGTPNYVSPEVLSGRPYDFKCDIWSSGVVLFLLLSGGYLPFFPEEDEDVDMRDSLLEKVRAGKWKFEPEKAWSKVSDSAKDLVTKMMAKHPAERISYEDILKHPWMRSDDEDEEEKDAKKKKSARSKFQQMRKIDMASFRQLKQKVDEMRAEKNLRSTEKVLEAVGAFSEMLIPSSENEDENAL